MRNLWFKFHNRARHSRKVNAIADKHFRAWVMFGTLASENNGEITKDLSTLSFELHRKPGQVRESLQTLLSIGLIENAGKVYRMARWEEMQLNPTGSAQRMRDFRERHKTVTVTRNGDATSGVTVTTEGEEDTEGRQERSCREVSNSIRTMNGRGSHAAVVAMLACSDDSPFGLGDEP